MRKKLKQEEKCLMLLGRGYHRDTNNTDSIGHYVQNTTVCKQRDVFSCFPVIFVSYQPSWATQSILQRASITLFPEKKREPWKHPGTVPNCFKITIFLFYYFFLWYFRKYFFPTFFFIVTLFSQFETRKHDFSLLQLSAIPHVSIMWKWLFISGVTKFGPGGPVSLQSLQSHKMDHYYIILY